MWVFFPLGTICQSISPSHNLTYISESMESDEKWCNKHIINIVAMLSVFVEKTLDHMETEKFQPYLVLVHSGLLQNGANTNCSV